MLEQGAERGSNIESSTHRVALNDNNIHACGNERVVPMRRGVRCDNDDRAVTHASRPDIDIRG